MLFFAVTLVVVILTSACTNPGYKKTIDTQTVVKDIGKITAEQLEVKETEDGTTYIYKIVNGSPYLIKQNVVYFSYYISVNNGYKGNPFKIEARDNKLDIYPGEEITLTVFAPKEMYQNNELLIIEDPSLEMKGYLNEVNYKNQFHMTLK